jgi:ribosomal protein S18 acetylase RimI-like enzyme
MGLHSKEERKLGDKKITHLIYHIKKLKTYHCQWNNISTSTSPLLPGVMIPTSLTSSRKLIWISQSVSIVPYIRKFSTTTIMRSHSSLIVLSFAIIPIYAFSNSAPGVWSIFGALFRPPGMTTVPTFGDRVVLSEAADFFTDAFWGSKMTKSRTLSPKQRSSILQSQIAEFRKRYGSTTSSTFYDRRAELWVAQIPSAQGKIVGCCGMEVDTIYEGGLQKNDGGNRRPIRAVAPVMSNVAVSREFRRRGIAEALVGEAERTARLEWGYDEIYLYVEERNTPAVRLYRKLGYRQVWKDSTATALQPLEDGSVGMKQIPTTLICMRKPLSQLGLWRIRLPF